MGAYWPPFLCPVDWRRPVPKMINLARLHCYRAGIFELKEVHKAEYEVYRRLLISEGYVIVHVDFV